LVEERKSKEKEKKRKGKKEPSFAGSEGN